MPKRIISLATLICLIMTVLILPNPAMANISSNEELLQSLGVDSKAVKELREISINNLNRKEIYEEFGLKEIVVPEDYILVSESIYVVSLWDTKYTNSSLNYETRIVFHEHQAVSKEKQLNKNIGMRQALSTIFNIVIGQIKYSYIPAAILGVVASHFSDEYSDGDILRQHDQRVYLDKYIQVREPNTNNWWSCAKAIKLTLTNYLDLYAIGNNGQGVRKTETEIRSYQTKNYSNNVFLEQKAKQEYYVMSGMSMYVDPW